MNQLIAEQDNSPAADSEYSKLLSTLQEFTPEQSVRLLKQFLQTYPSFAHGHNDLGVIFHHAGNPTLALAHHEKACRLQPENITFKKNLADFYAVELGWLDDAVDIYLEILKRNPRDIEALIAVGKLGSAMEDTLSIPHSDMTNNVSSSPQTAVQQPAAYLQQRTAEDIHEEAVRYHSGGGAHEAHSLLEELVHLYPDYAPGHNDLGVLRYSLGDSTGAALAYQQAVRLQPRNNVFRKNLADLYFTDLDRADDAISIYLDIFYERPDDIDTLLSLGQLCSAVGHPSESKNFYRRILELEPWHTEARKALSII